MPLKSKMCSQPQRLSECYNFPLAVKAMLNNTISEAEAPLILESIWTTHRAVAHKWVLQKAEEIYAGEVQRVTAPSLGLRVNASKMASVRLEDFSMASLAEKLCNEVPALWNLISYLLAADPQTRHGRYMRDSRRARQAAGGNGIDVSMQDEVSDDSKTPADNQNLGMEMGDSDDEAMWMAVDQNDQNIDTGIGELDIAHVDTGIAHSNPENGQDPRAKACKTSATPPSVKIIPVVRCLYCQCP